MTIETTPNGFIKISDIIGNYLVTRKYMGYTKSQAIKLFKQEFKKGGKK
jgi:hypothetical protein